MSRLIFQKSLYSALKNGIKQKKELILENFTDIAQFSFEKKNKKQPPGA